MNVIESTKINVDLIAREVEVVIVRVGMSGQCESDDWTARTLPGPVLTTVSVSPGITVTPSSSGWAH